jgi:hypothetical protein
VIENDDFSSGGMHRIANFFDLAPAHEETGVGSPSAALNYACALSARGEREFLEFRDVGCFINYAN